MKWNSKVLGPAHEIENKYDGSPQFMIFELKGIIFTKESFKSFNILKEIKMKLLLTLVVLVIGSQTFAQEVSVMAKRAREMHRVIGLDDKQQWIRFIKENYTQALIDKQQNMKVQSNENGNVSTSKEEIKESDKLEAKAKMFARLHEDFGGSKIVSIKPEGNKLEMILNNGDGLIGTFKLLFDKNKPYLIDGIGIEAGN